MPVKYIKPFLTLVVLIVSLSGLAKERIALVIGNADYTSSSLINSVNDAADIASTLEDLDFSVALVKNADQERMESAISEFTSSLNDDTVGLFYYSGHAVQYKGNNYLVPIGSVGKVDQASDLPKYTVSTNTVLGGLNQSQSNLNFVFLDACRDNPFKNFSKEITPGLAKTSVGTRSTSTNLTIGDMFITRGVSETHEQVKDTKGILVAYSTMPGNIASDGRGRNSPYTKSLLKHISKTNSLAQIMLSDVQQDVQKETGGKQTPIFESAITGRFCFNETNNGCGKAVVNIHSSYLKGIKDIQKLTLPDGSSYEGQIVDGKPYGKGIQIHKNGDRYEGEWKDGLGHGKGYWYGVDGHYAEGEWKNDIQHGFNIVRNKFGRYEGNFINGSPGGFGIYLWANGNRFEGEWVDGYPVNGMHKISDGVTYKGEMKKLVPHGIGTIIFKDGSTFKANFNLLFSNKEKVVEVTVNAPSYKYKGGSYKSERSGYGEISWSNGDSYKGNFLNHMRHGQGVNYKANGDRYKGEYKKGKRHGWGVQDYADGTRYIGSWKDDLYHEKGTRYYESGSVYQGSFQDGFFHGKGIYTWSDGGRYEGGFKDGKTHGKAIKTWANGDRYEGGYEEGKMHGKGVFTWADGDRYEGEWKNGEIIEKK